MNLRQELGEKQDEMERMEEQKRELDELIIKVSQKQRTS